jgi:HSP20 family protein
MEVDMFLVPMTRGSSELARSFDRLFDESFDRFFSPGTPQQGAVARSPALDVAESERAYTVTMDMPGVAKDEVKIAIDGRRVSVEARTSKSEEKKEGDRVIYRERSESSYARSFTLPGEVDQRESSAKLENGVLKLELAKRRASTAAQLSVS